MVGGRTSRCCAEMVAIGICGSDCFLPTLGLSVWESSVHLGRRVAMGAECKRASANGAGKVGILLLLRFKLFTSHPIPSHLVLSWRLSPLFRFSIVESSLLSDLASSSPSVVFLVQRRAPSGTAEPRVEILIHLRHITDFPSNPSFLSPGVQDILSLIAETDQERRLETRSKCWASFVWRLWPTKWLPVSSLNSPQTPPSDT
ncbi:hypothetical protein B0T18DRAFT_245611 [Schizothecium vesticola]|uniref:Uncharacterized protein n=1 Tax=Schizothecium vesticola TaxID=314040 RepID=A0AA40BQ73_9PEZI|nr:hypothetical protein B0T18DRAFT_245611 [Schizothecium vesticola]